MSGEPQPSSGFSDVDATGSADRLGDYLQTVSGVQFTREAKAASLAALGLVAGSRALDVGCGLGEDVLAIAAKVGPGGRAVGVDTSRAFIGSAVEAAQRSGSIAEYIVADGHDLPFDDASFDAARTERTLQHVRDPGAVLREMARVVVAGGVITASEPDWDTLVVDLEPVAVSRRVQTAFGRTVRNPTVGRSLRRLAIEAGLADVQVEARTIVITDLRLASELFDLPLLADEVISAGDLPKSDVDSWLESVMSARANDGFFAAATGFVAVARKP